MSRIRVTIKCGDKLINEHSNGGEHHGWNNPFDDFIPAAGDVIELGGRYYGPEDDNNSEGKLYRVTQRTFKAYESWNCRYTKQECLLEVEEVV